MLKPLSSIPTLFLGFGAYEPWLWYEKSKRTIFFQEVFLNPIVAGNVFTATAE